MGTRFKLSVRLSKLLLLQAAFLLLLRNSTRALDNDNVFELSISSETQMRAAREEATRELEEPQLTYPGRLFEMGWRITGMNPDELERAKEVDKLGKEGSESSTPQKLDLLDEEMSEHDRIRDDRFGYQVYQPLLRCLQDTHTVQLTSQAEEDLRGLLYVMTNELHKLYKNLPRNVAEHSEHVRAPRKKPIVKVEDGLASSTHHLTSSSNAFTPPQDDFARLFLKNIQSALKLLSDPINFNNAPVVASFTMAFRLNDIFLRLLATLENYNLVTTDCLSWIINEETKGHVIKNYIFSFYPNDLDAVGICLNFHDFKRSVEMSGFTKEVHNLMRFIKPDTWYNLERLHLMLLSTQATSSHRGLGINFARITSPHTLTRANKAVLSDMIKKLLNEHNFQHDKSIRFEPALTHLLCLHKIISFLVKHHVSPETMTHIKESIFFQAVDEAINLLHYSLKTVYIQYAELLKIEAGMLSPLTSKITLNRGIRKYMIDPGQNTGGLSTSSKTMKNEDASDLFGLWPTKKTTTTSLQKPEKSEWKALDDQEWSNFLASLERFDVDHEQKKGLNPSPVVSDLKHASQLIVKHFEQSFRYPSSHEKPNSYTCGELKSALEKILSNQYGFWLNFEKKRKLSPLPCQSKRTKYND